MKKLTEQEQQRRLEKAARNIADAEAALASPDGREAYCKFIARYSLCELGYKSLLAEHIKDLGGNRATISRLNTSEFPLSSNASGWKSMRKP